MLPVIGTTMGLASGGKGKSKQTIVSVAGGSVNCVFDVGEVVLLASSAVGGAADITGSLFSSSSPPRIQNRSKKERGLLCFICARFWFAELTLNI